jgi:hypothetical protein
MEDVLRSKGLYQISLGKDQEPTDDDTYAKWANRNDEARGLIRISISLDLRFHLQGIKGLDKAWENLEVVFGKHNIIQAHQLENQLMILSPNDFPCNKDYLSKFKTLTFLCIGCQLDMKEDRCIYVTLAKFSNAYSIFVSTCYATREVLGSVYKQPSLKSFCDALIREQDKLVQLGLINIVGTSNKALTTTTSKQGSQTLSAIFCS